MDLTNLTLPDSACWPAKHKLNVSTQSLYETDGFFAVDVHLNCGFGTHMDSPSHSDKDGRQIADLKITELIGKCVIIDVTPECEKNPDYTLTIGRLKKFEEDNFEIPNESIILLKTGWGKYFKEDSVKYLNANPNEKCSFTDIGTMHFPKNQLNF